MITDTQRVISQFEDIITNGVTRISNMRPSVFAEQNIVMPKPLPGLLQYNNSPYTREIIDCLAPDHPARVIAIMKAAQLGLSATVIIPGLLWMIKHQPGNTYYLVGSQALVEKAAEKLDIGINNAGMRDYIQPQAQRSTRQKTGDTNTKKEFPWGYIHIGNPNNHKDLRDVSLMYGMFDDLEAFKKASAESGDTLDLLEMRFVSFAETMKMFLISTPELKRSSLIEPAFLKGDQRYYNIPCPCCHELIVLEWKVATGGGITWELDNHGAVIDKSVGYVCQKCAGFFTEAKKYDFLINGNWVPTAVPSRPGYYSYRINCLYSPVTFAGWGHYVMKYLEANPVDQPRNERKHQTFENTCLANTYDVDADEPTANSIQKNTRPYEIGTVPEQLSMKDGNGHIVLLTCSADMNGTEFDARLDYEIVAWAKNGARYSITHGSVGTFVPLEGRNKDFQDRVKWTYEQGKKNSVWPEFEKILDQVFYTDAEEKERRALKVGLSGLDVGFHKNHAFAFLGSTHIPNVVGLRGRGEDSLVKFGVDVPIFKPSIGMENTYLLQVGLIKDELSANMSLRWNEGQEDQPDNFMNYPQPAGGLYGFSNYFEHFESEHRVIQTNKDGNGISALWKKKKSTSQNHNWDLAVYNIALKSIFIFILGKEFRKKDFSWKDYIELLGV
jgi:phage terminase large subunit GpA-like protein